jgi:uncharacterized surface anchored protein
MVIASGILLTVLSSTMSMVVFASDSGSNAARRGTALNIANSVIERARNLPFDDVGVRFAGGGYGEPPGAIVTPDTVTYPGFTVSTSIAWVNSGGRAAYKEMSVTVEWAEPTAGSVTLETGIFGATDLVNVGDLRVTAIDADTGLPLFRAAVRVDPYDATAERTACTDAKGVSYFGRVGQGAAVVTLTLAGYVFDQSLTSAVSIDKDSVREIVVYGRRSSTLSVRVSDAAGPVAGATVTLTDSRGKVLRGTTGSTGATPDFTDLLVGTYSLDVSASGGRTADQTFVIVSRGGESLVKDVTLTVAVAAGQLQLTVRDKATLRSLDGVTLRLFASSGAEVAGSATSTVGGKALWSGLAPGSYTCSASKTGYTPASGVAVNVVAGQSAYCTIDLVATAATTGSIRVLVTDTAGRPLNRTRVYLRHPGAGGIQVNARTDSSGLVSWGNLPMGTYTLWVDGMATAIQQASPGSPYTALTFVVPR